LATNTADVDVASSAVGPSSSAVGVSGAAISGTEQPSGVLFDTSSPLPLVVEFVVDSTLLNILAVVFSVK